MCQEGIDGNKTGYKPGWGNSENTEPVLESETAVGERMTTAAKNQIKPGGTGTCGVMGAIGASPGSIKKGGSQAICEIREGSGPVHASYQQSAEHIGAYQGSVSPYEENDVELPRLHGI